MEILEGMLIRINMFYMAGFLLLVTVTAQQCSSRLNGSLLFAEKDSIVIFNGNGSTEEVVTWTPNRAVNLDYDYQRNILYWADVTNSEIYALDEKSSKPRLVVPEQSHWLAHGMAVEPVTDKIYLGNYFSGTMRIFDLKNNKSIDFALGNDVIEVKCLAIDADSGYLFVLDEYRILRIDLDGTNRKVLLCSEDMAYGEENANDRTLKVNKFTIDQETKRLYWVDSLTRKVESIDYDGEDRKVHFHDTVGQPYPVSIDSLAILDGYLYWSDPIEQQFFVIDAKTGNSSKIQDRVPSFLKAISCPSQKPIVNPCADNNGQCEQLCLLSRSSQGNYKCACDIGYELAKDQKSCNALHDFILFTQDKHLRGQSLSVGSKAYAIDPWRFYVGTATTIDYNIEAGMIYYNQNLLNITNHLRQFRLDNGEASRLQPDLHSKNVRNLAYDWASKNLYYFSYYYANMTSLNVFNVEDPSYSKIILDDVQGNVTNVVVHPHRGYVYFAQLISDKDTRISRLATDGSDLEVIVKLPEKSFVEGLAIDLEEDKLYWSQVERVADDKFSFRLRYSNLNGTDVQDDSLPNVIPGLLDLDIQGEYIYAISSSRTQLIRLNKKNSSSDMVVLAEGSTPGTLSRVKVFSRKTQSIKLDHPCASGKHQCAKFCFAVPNGEGGLKGICGCPYGKKLAEDSKSCVDNSKAEPPFVRCEEIAKCNKVSSVLNSFPGL